MRAIFHPDSIEFENYPFAPASVASGKRLPHALIRDVDVSASPPEIRTQQGETLFVSAVQREAFQAAVHSAAIPTQKRFDVWDNLLEPFLDTEFTQSAHYRTIESLCSRGFTEDEIVQIRSRVERPMIHYNFDVPRWEWVSLRLFDLLSAFQPRCPLWTWIDPRVNRFQRFYWDAMRIAERGCELPNGTSRGEV